MKKRFLVYWISSIVFAVLIGEVLTGIISGNPMFFMFAIPITLYYVVLCFLFSLMITRVRLRYSLIVFFIYGVLVEWLLFRNIKGPTDIVGIIFFGLLYVFLFGVPWWFTKKVVGKEELKRDLRKKK